jgi:hypothetical protein
MYLRPLFDAPKSKRLPRRRPVTLIPAFRCMDDTFAVCGDSQETVTIDGNEYRVTRQKIKPEICGNFELAIGGSSLSGPLIDACVRRIHKSTKRFGGTGLAELEDFLSNELLDFGKRDAKLYSKKERVARFLIAARSIKESSVQCWHTEATQLIPIERSTLVGYNEALYQHILERLYPETGPLLPLQRAVLLGMYILELAEKTSNYVRGPITVIVAKPNKISVLPKVKVQRFKEQISLFSSQMDSLLLSFADYTISRPQYQAKLEEFKATLLQLRDDYVQEALPKSIEELEKTNDPVQSLPVPCVLRGFADGRIEFSEDPRDMERIQGIIRSLPSYPFHLPCSGCGAEFEYHVAIPIGQAKRGRFVCPECGTDNQTIAAPLRFRKIGEAAWTEVPPPDEKKERCGS